jgi:hypothetical protein
MGVENEKAKQNIPVQDKSAAASRELHKKDFQWDFENDMYNH